MIKPIRDRILVKPADAETQTKSGLFIPETATDAPDKGKVIAVGSGKITDKGNLIALTVVEGDTVLYSKGSGVTTKVNDEEYLILTEDQVLATVSE